MSKEKKYSFVVIILPVLVTAIFAALGFILKFYYFDPRQAERSYSNQEMQSLYEKGSEEFKKIYEVYVDIHNLMDSEYALTTYQLTPELKKLREARKSYMYFVNELKRKGSPRQITVAKSVGERLNKSYLEFDLQYRMVEKLQKDVAGFLPIDNEEVFRNFNIEFERLVQNENRIYYEIQGDNVAIRTLEQSLNYEFRRALGLEITNEMIKELNNAVVKANQQSKVQYENTEYPFLFAKTRAFNAATLKIEDRIGIVADRNKFLQLEASGKFFQQIVDAIPKVKKRIKNKDGSK
ncbi:hypothetical protein [Neisseria animaloris]|uniref:hypothetical protein n=1 Tax=Neisseria animaloris TaxID=326522 RepID=UPI000D30E255|nr:hypothetical protein [Neisseria animaloris]